MIEIWHCDLNTLPANKHAELLANSEKLDPQAAACFPDKTKQLHRLANRRMIQKKTGCDLKDLKFTPHGKPFLKTGPHFSIAHDANWVLVAFADLDLGIDVQAMVPRNISTLVARFHPEEQEYLNALSEKEQLQAFYRIWTRKESLLKASAVGMTVELNAFSVLSDHISFRGMGWTFVDISRFEQMACCLCVPEAQVSLIIQFVSANPEI